MAHHTLRAPLVEARDLRVAAGAASPVDRVSITLHPGEVLGLLGQNGAGQTALMQCLSGMRRATAGEIFVNGQSTTITRVQDARALGIETIHQTLALACNLDAAANLFLGRELVSVRGQRDMAAMQAETRRIMAQVNPGFQAFDVPVSTLTAGQRLSLAVARAVYFNVKVMILDNPVATLEPSDLPILTGLLQDVKRRGIGVFLVEQDIHSAMTLCDRVAVMKNGRIIGTARVAETTDSDLLGMIILGKTPAKAA